MLHVPITTSCAALLAPQPPLKAGDYLRLRREAAGLSVGDVAAALASTANARGDAAAFIRMIERPEARLTQGSTLLRLQSVFPFDPSVYQQLCDEPTDRHPQICRSCGCSHWDPCDDEVRGPCGWSTESTCTHCEEGAAS